MFTGGTEESYITLATIKLACSNFRGLSGPRNWKGANKSRAYVFPRAFYLHVTPMIWEPGTGYKVIKSHWVI